jgi:hypothetical protein
MIRFFKSETRTKADGDLLQLQGRGFPAEHLRSRERVTGTAQKQEVMMTVERLVAPVIGVLFLFISGTACYAQADTQRAAPGSGACDSLSGVADNVKAIARNLKVCPDLELIVRRQAVPAQPAGALRDELRQPAPGTPDCKGRS